MPFYAHSQNKRLLWKTIQSCPLFKKATVDWSWFQHIIESFSQKYFTDLSPNELLEANQETILYMIEDMENQLGIRKPRGLKELGGSGVSNMVPLPPPVLPEPGGSENFGRIIHHQSTHPFDSGTKGRDHPPPDMIHETVQYPLVEPIYINDGRQRGNEFMPMRESLDRLKPDTPNFVVSQELDTKESIEDLMEKMQREREQDLGGIIPVSSSSSIPPSEENKQMTTISESHNTIMTFDQTEPPNQLHIKDPPTSRMTGLHKESQTKEMENLSESLKLFMAEYNMKLRTIEEKVDMVLNLLRGTVECPLTHTLNKICSAIDDEVTLPPPEEEKKEQQEEEEEKKEQEEEEEEKKEQEEEEEEEEEEDENTIVNTSV